MSVTVEAIYEGGVLKPVQPLTLLEGTHVSLVITATAEEQVKQSPAAILTAIASLPLEATDLSFANQDHDQILYGNGDEP